MAKEATNTPSNESLEAQILKETEHAKELLKNQRLLPKRSFDEEQTEEARDAFKAAGPENFLPEVLKFCKDEEEKEVVEAFVMGINNGNINEQYYKPENSQCRSNSYHAEELSRRLTRMITGYKTFYEQSGYLKYYVENTLKKGATTEEFKEKLIPLIKVLNRALAARTRYYQENYSIPRVQYGLRGDDITELRVFGNNTGFIQEKDNDSFKKYQLPGIEDLKNWLDRDNEEPEDKRNPEVQRHREKIEELYNRMMAITQKYNWEYYPHTYIPKIGDIDRGEDHYYSTFSIEQQLELIEDQLRYLEEFVPKNEEKRNEARRIKEEAERVKREAEEAEIRKMEDETEDARGKLATLMGPGENGVNTMRKLAETSLGRLKEAKELSTDKMIEEIGLINSPSTLRRNATYLKDISEFLAELIAAVKVIQKSNEYEDSYEDWRELPEGEITMPQADDNPRERKRKLTTANATYKNRLKHYEDAHKQAKERKDTNDTRLEKVLSELKELKGKIDKIDPKSFKKKELPIHIEKLVEDTAHEIGAI